MNQKLKVTSKFTEEGPHANLESKNLIAKEGDNIQIKDGVDETVAKNASKIFNKDELELYSFNQKFKEYLQTASETVSEEGIEEITEEELVSFAKIIHLFVSKTGEIYLNEVT